MRKPSPRSHGPAGRALACLCGLAAVLVLAVSPQAQARDREARVAGTCGRGADSGLRLRSDGGKIRIRFRVRSNRDQSRWRVVLIHEGRIAWRGRVRAGGGGSFDVRRRVRNLRGADTVTARALGPRGVTCIASATLRG
jgi:hypothetical protein